MKKTSKAPANIAFIKYWGRKNEKLRLPLNSSISMNLSEAYTITTVEFLKSHKQDEIIIKNGRFLPKDADRIIEHLERIRRLAKSRLFAKVVTENNFPRNAGIASSASGFAALTMAATKALGLDLTEKELSILSRLASGSSARSIPDGFVEWKEGEKSEDSFAYSLYNEQYWDLRDLVLILDEERKKTSSSEGHRQISSSPFLKVRLSNLSGKIISLKKALKEKDFYSLGEIIEQEAIEMHAIMMTQGQPLFYLTGKTIELIEKTRELRKDGLPVYFTLDAGPNMHLICEGKNEKRVLDKVKKLEEVKHVIINKPGQGAKLVESHLF